MNREELAFVNQQLAGMLRSGIPLEGALRQLCANMKRGKFREELQALEADLAKGVPLPEALASRKLPEFYVRMLQLGAQTDDLPGVLTLVADYYQQAHLVGTRLKGLMVYPSIVLLASLGLSGFLAVICHGLMTGGNTFLDILWDYRLNAAESMDRMLFQLWAPVVALSLATLALVITMTVPRFRHYLRWWLPGFRENSLTNLASAMNLMLSHGSHLGEALELARHLETGTPAGAELQRWKTRLAAGNARIDEIAAGSKVFPPLFIWLAAQGGQDLAAGFKKAADIFRARALYRIEMLLYAALPVTVLVLGLMIFSQYFPIFRMLTLWIDSLGNMGN